MTRRSHLTAPADRMTSLMATLLAGSALVVACSSSSPAHEADAGLRDAAVDAPRDAKGKKDAAAPEASVDASSPEDTGPIQHPEDAGGSIECTSSTGCPAGDVCCASVGGLVKQAVCSTGKSCAGGAEACATVGAKCLDGTCEKYVCTQSGIGIKSVVLACAMPVVANGMCSQVASFDGGGPGPGADGG